MRIATANNHKQKWDRRHISEQCRLFHLSQLERQTRSGTLHKNADTGFLRRQRKKAKAMRATVHST